MFERGRGNLSTRYLTFGVGLCAALLAPSRSIRAEMLASSLPVEIRGVISSSDPRACVALLQDVDRGKLIAVKPGYFIFDKQAKVVSIPSAKTVIIDRGNNQLEYLGDKPAPDAVAPTATQGDAAPAAATAQPAQP